VRFAVVFALICVGFLRSVFAGAYLTEINEINQVIQRKWSTPAVIKWRYNPTNAPANIEAIITAAFNTWATHSSVNFDHEFHGTTLASGPSKNGYTDFFFNVDFPSQGLDSNLIAIAFLNGSLSGARISASNVRLSEGDVLMNPALKDFWKTEGITAATDLDVQEILTHEIGHVLGLGHSFLIDAMMYPGKPQPSTPELGLFRFPKRTLTQDDLSWASKMHPDRSARSSYARIEGRVLYDGYPYIGAHIIAMKVDEDDLTYPFSNDNADLLVRGLKNVSAFSELGGRFSIDYLEPGQYKIVVQNGKSFLDFSLVNVNGFLGSAQSPGNFPLDVYRSPYCSTGSGFSFASFGDGVAASSTFVLSANQSICNLEFYGRASDERCARVASLKGPSCGGGGCSLRSNPDFDYNQNMRSYLGTILFVVGSIIIMLSLKSALVRRGMPKRNRPPR
jgi:hypothetical protein